MIIQCRGVVEYIMPGFMKLKEKFINKSKCDKFITEIVVSGQVDKQRNICSTHGGW
jgi:hypothetical protein